VDAVVFELGAQRYGAQQSQVAEVLALGPITPVPAAPAELVGAMNVHGRVVPVLDLGLVLTGRASTPQPGEEGLLLRAAEHEAVAYVGRVRQVCALERTDAEWPTVSPTAAGQTGAIRELQLTRPAVDAAGQAVLLLDLERLLLRVAERVARVAARMQVNPLEPADAGVTR
jgi:chemotaxis signal transduction protein